ncbi:hypothetical protein NKJ84_28530 [Mesorhizobium sp. M0048]
MMNRRTLVVKTTNAYYIILLRAMTGFAAERRITMEVGAATGSPGS